MKKNISLLIMLVIIIPIMTGCWDQKGVDKLAIVIGLGIDQTDKGNIRLTAQVVKPTSSNEIINTKSKIELITSEGTDIQQAINNFSKITSQIMFFPHVKVIVFGRKIVISGINDIVDYVNRNPSFRKTSCVLVTDKKASEILMTDVMLQEYPSIGIEGIVAMYDKTSQTVGVKWKDFIKNIDNINIGTLASKIYIVENKEEKKKIIEIQGTFIIKKGKLIGELDNKETEALLWVRSKGKNGSLTLNCPDGQPGKLGLTNNNVKTKLNKITYDEKNGQMAMEIQVKVASEIEKMACEKSVNQKFFNKIESEQASKMKLQIESMLEKTKMLNTDVIDFLSVYQNKNPRKMKEIKNNWENTFKKINISVKVESTIKNTGMSLDSKQNY